MIVLRQLVPLGEIDHQVIAGRAFPPCGIIVELRNLVEAELLVVIGPNPFGGVDSPTLQSWIDVASGDLLGHTADLPDSRSSKATDAKLEAVKVCKFPDFLVKPSTHLT